MADTKIKTMMGFVTANVVLAIVEEMQLTTPEALKAFYNSEVFDRLCDPETGLYREGGGYVYDLYTIEKEHGHLVQLEI